MVRFAQGLSSETAPQWSLQETLCATAVQQGYLRFPSVSQVPPEYLWSSAQGHPGQAILVQGLVLV